MDKAKIMKGLEECTNDKTVCDKDCPYYSAGFCRENLMIEVLALLKEQEETIKNLCQEIRDKNERLKERAEQVDAMLKEQEAYIIAMSRFLESHGWDSDSICGKNVEIVVTNGDDDDA